MVSLQVMLASSLILPVAAFKLLLVSLYISWNVLAEMRVGSFTEVTLVWEKEINNVISQVLFKRSPVSTAKDWLSPLSLASYWQFIYDWIICFELQIF